MRETVGRHSGMTRRVPHYETRRPKMGRRGVPMVTRPKNELFFHAPMKDALCSTAEEPESNAQCSFPPDVPSIVAPKNESPHFAGTQPPPGARVRRTGPQQHCSEFPPRFHRKARVNIGRDPECGVGSRRMGPETNSKRIGPLSPDSAPTVGAEKRESSFRENPASAAALAGPRSARSTAPSPCTVCRPCARLG
jgi:hypothetical protein